MITHDGIWAAIDSLAEKLGKSCSALARNCGLDSTTFNPSKRHDKYGKPRWPSSQTISKILKTTGLNEAEFFNLGRTEQEK